MAIKQKTVVVNGDEFMLSTFPAGKGLKLLKQLTRLVGPAFAEMLKGSEEGQTDAMSLALEKLFDNLDEVDVETLVKELVTSATKASVTINFDMEFSGAYDTLFELVREIVEFNFGNVFTLFGTGQQ